MKFFITNARLLLTGLIVAAFFLPSYGGISGFRFISLAFSEINRESEITSTDVFIMILPLIMIPVFALLLFIGAALKQPMRKILTGMPLICLCTFLAILLVGARNGSGSFSGPEFLVQMQVGFYLAFVASILLVATKDPRKKRVKRRKRTEAELAA